MIKLLLLFCFFVLSSCYTANDVLDQLERSGSAFKPLKTEVDIYWEWGLIVVKSVDLQTNGSLNLVKFFNTHQENSGDALFGCVNQLGKRVYFDKDANLNGECLYDFIPNKYHFQSRYGRFFQPFFNRNFVFDVGNDAFRVFYAGDSLLIEPGQVRNHKRIEQNYLAVKDEQGRIRETLQGPIYEFDIPLNEPVFSFIVRTNPKDLKGYKPLKLDPSIFPLESPGYKKLREQEEKLSRGE